MRILIINYEYPPLGGGASNASYFLANAFVTRGHDVCVMTSAFRDLRGLSIENGVHVHRIRSFRRSIDRSDLAQMMAFAVSGVLCSRRIICSEKPDGAISFFTLPSGLIGYWLSACHHLPHVVSLRGGDVPGLVPEVEAAHRRTRGLRRRVLGSAEAIVANDDGLARLSETADPFPVTVIPNGVDGSMFSPCSPANARDADAPFRILFAGRLRRQKNLSLLLDQLAAFDQSQRTRFTLTVIGDGPLEGALRDRAAQLGIGDRITWHGWVSKSEVVKHFQNAECFVNPSLYEGLPNTVLEAMACGLPVVASRVAGNDTLVVDHTTGLLFDLDQPDQLGEALSHLMSDRTLARRMGSNGRNRALEKYSWDPVAESYLQLLTGSDKTERDSLAARPEA